jgi:hypothetical protein
MDMLEYLRSLEKAVAPDNDAARSLITKMRSASQKHLNHIEEMDRYREILARTVTIAANSGLDPVAGHILEALMHVIGATRGFVGLVEGDGRRFLPARNIDYGDVEDPDTQISSRVIEQTVKTGRVFVGDAMGDVGSKSVHALPGPVPSRT